MFYFWSKKSWINVDDDYLQPLATLTFSMPGSPSMRQRFLATKQRLVAGLHEPEGKLFPSASLQFPEVGLVSASLRQLPDFPELPSISGSWSWILYHPLYLACLAFNTREHLIICHEVSRSVWLTVLVFVFVFLRLFTCQNMRYK